MLRVNDPDGKQGTKAKEKATRKAAQYVPWLYVTVFRRILGPEG